MKQQRTSTIPAPIFTKASAKVKKSSLGYQSQIPTSAFTEASAKVKIIITVIAKFLQKLRQSQNHNSQFVIRHSSIENRIIFLGGYGNCFSFAS